MRDRIEHMRASLLALVLVGTPAMAGDATGRWLTTIEGESLTLTLSPGGRGDLEGDPITWRARGDQVTLIVDGEQEVGRLKGDRLSFAEFSFTRMPSKATAKTQEAQKQDAPPGAAARREDATPKLPPRDNALAQRIIGCWSHSSGTTDATSYDRSNERWLFTTDGRYQMESVSVISGDFGSARSGSSQTGRWTTARGQLLLQPDDAEPFAVRLTFQGGIALVDGRKYLPCR